jgi:integrase
MAIKKMPSGRYRFDYRDPKGARVRKTYGTKREALDARDKIGTSIANNSYIPPKQRPVFGAIAEEWFRGKCDRRPGTVANWKAQLDLHLIPRLGNIRLDRIDVALMESLRDDLRKTLSAKSVKAVLTTAGAIFKLAIRRELTTRNPAADAERPFEGATELTAQNETGESRHIAAVKPSEVLTPAEMRKMLDCAARGLYRTLFLASCMTGMRSGELFALRWSDIEFGSRPRIFVRRTLSWSRAQDEKGSVRAKFFAPKTQAGQREIPLAEPLAIALKSWKLESPTNDGDLVFATADGQPIRRSNALRYGLWPALRRAQLRKVNMHSLRHSFASSLIMGNAPITEVQHLLGHSSPAVTLRVYSHWFRDLKTESVERLAGLLVNEEHQDPSPSHNGHFLDTSEVAVVAASA